MNMTLKKWLKITSSALLLFAVLFLIRIKPARIVFGSYAGECTGNCGTMYQVTAKIIIEDTTSFWQAQNDLRKLEIKAQRLVVNDHEGNFEANKIAIPLIMLLDPRTVFGCPDCHDQGGYYLEFTLPGIKRHFKIDKEHEPFYFPDLTDKIENKIQEVRKELISNR